jgi:hypothetical protein
VHRRALGRASPAAGQRRRLTQRFLLSSHRPPVKDRRVEANDQAAGYKIWGADNVVYGPVELPTLVTWIQEERVLADTWV